MTETTKQRIDREIKDEFMRQRGGPEADDIGRRFEKLREDYHRKCDEVVALRDEVVKFQSIIERRDMEIGASRANEQKAREERDAALVKLSKIHKFMEEHAMEFPPCDLLKAIKPLFPEDPLLPRTRKGTVATRST